MSGDAIAPNANLIVLLVGLIVAGATAGTSLGVGRWRSRKNRDLDVNAETDTRDWDPFEKYIARLLQDQGYEHLRLMESFDKGIDLTAQKDGVKWGIQIKRQDSPVEMETVRSAFAGLIHCGCQRAMVITNNFFTDEAKIYAKNNNCLLIDLDKLDEWGDAAQLASANQAISLD